MILNEQQELRGKNALSVSTDDEGQSLSEATGLHLHFLNTQRSTDDLRKSGIKVDVIRRLSYGV